jgi:phenylalanyl-tRNA synthetase alpha chain
VNNLHRLERKLLHALRNRGTLSFKEVENITSLSQASITKGASWLLSKGLVKITETRKDLIKLGDRGLTFLEQGFPERRILKFILRHEGESRLKEIQKLSDVDSEEINAAIGWASKKKWIKITRINGEIVLKAEKEPELGLDERVVEFISRKQIPIDEVPTELQPGIQLLKQRPNTVILDREVKRYLTLTETGIKTAQKVKEIEEISQLTPELIKNGRWRSIKLRKYDVTAPTAEVWPGKEQPYLKFLNDVKAKLVSLGFKEMEGSLVEISFFNCDALYMPQDHPAREIHDMYFAKNPKYADLSAYKVFLDRVKRAHENGGDTGSKGWRYDFSDQKAKRIILRSQGTASSARTLMSKNLEIPGKYFSIARCYRPEVVDRTHLPEFNQIEGIVIDESLTFRDLLGVLERFALEIAKADKVRFKPDYFPFTEPSVELAAYKEGLGWIEFGGAGIFRPEMTIPLGIKVPVIAWGLGVDRLFMTKAKIDDIRQLFTHDLEWLRRKELI